MGEAVRVRTVEAFAVHEIEGLSDVLIDCVEGGASVSFMLPMTRAKADAFWRGAAASARRGERVVIAAEDEAGTITGEPGAIIGTVQVIWAQPENQPHRGDLAKMLVHRRARRRGIGALLLHAAERAAFEAGRTVLVLDTASGDAERLYARQGWQRVGVVPNYALLPDGPPCATTIFYKSLALRVDEHDLPARLVLDQVAECLDHVAEGVGAVDARSAERAHRIDVELHRSHGVASRRREPR